MTTVRAESKLRILELEVGHRRENCKDELFCEIYDELVESIKVMDNINNRFIWEAFNTKFRKQLAILIDWNV